MTKLRNHSIRLLVSAFIGLLSSFYWVPLASAAPAPFYSHREEWRKDLPARDTVVDIATPMGRFRLPIGYVAEPSFLNLKRSSTDAQGRITFQMSKLAFKFIMPTGAMSNNAVRWFDADDASGQPDPDPNKYVVWFLDVERDVAGRKVPADWPKNVLVEEPAAALPPGVDHSYRGRIDLPATNDRVETELFRCYRDICVSHFYFDREGLTYWVLLPIEHHADAFLIAAKASELLAQWTVQP